MCDHLGDFQNIGSDKLDPFKIFLLLKSYENKSKYKLTHQKKLIKMEEATCNAGASSINATGSEGNDHQKNSLPNPFVVKKLYSLLNFSFGQQNRSADLSFYVTIDFRVFSKSCKCRFLKNSVIF